MYESVALIDRHYPWHGSLTGFHHSKMLPAEQYKMKNENRARAAA